MLVVSVPVAVLGYVLLYAFCRFMPLPSWLGMSLFVGVVLLHLRSRHRRRIQEQEQQVVILEAAIRRAAEKG
jgi:hypothetical protein